MKTTAGACGTSSPVLVSDTKRYYDGQGFGTAPTAGNVTETDVYSAGDPGVSDHWVKQSRVSYDSFGRVTSSQDAAGNTTTTAYTSSYGAGQPTTQVTVTSPLTSSTTATTISNLNPAWGAPSTTVDANGETTTHAYDPLGRATGVWLPGEATTSAANYAFAYSVTANAAPYVATTRLGPGGVQLTSYQIFDSLLRPRQVQAPAEGNAGMEVSDTFYDSRGEVVTQNGPYPASPSPSGTLFATTEAQVPNETATTYDGAGRPVEADFISYGTQQWKSTLAYPGGDAVTVVPPPGGTVTTTYTDARGRTTEIDQYHSKTSASGAYDATAYSYAYVTGGTKKTVTDAGGNTWTWSYDLLGREVSATDPDTGTTTSTYNDLSQLTSATDAAGKTISWAYDAAGRKTAQYAAAIANQSPSSQVAAWAYDSVAKGQLTSATSYVGGTGGEVYQETVNSYDLTYRPTSTTWSIPSNTVTGALAGSYTSTASYNIDGTLATAGFPAAGPLSAETVNFGYDALGLPYSAWSSLSDYAEQAFYDPSGQPSETDLGTSTAASALWSRMLYSYDPATLRLAQAQVQHMSSPGTWAADSAVSYGYDASGNVLSAANSVTADNQCFQYDYLARLTAAWSQPSATCQSSPPGTSGLGGPAPYQQTLSYDAGGTASGSTNGTTGQITGTTLITGTGSSASTTSTSFTYPAYGAARPHVPTGDTATVNGSPATTSNTWTAPGQLASTTTGSATTSYTWDGTGMTPGHLASVTTGTTATQYRYDASGNLLVVNDGGTSTLYLPDQELSATGSAITATRYYSLGGQLIAARTQTTGQSADGLTWLFSDPHGTATTAINAANQAVTRRYYTPFGAPRGPAPSSWPGTRGFVGGTADTTTGLTNLGAREYNPATPAFISPDPILNPADPQNLNPYTYAANNPATNSDPTGLCSQTWCPQNVNRNDNGNDNSGSNPGRTDPGGNPGYDGPGMSRAPLFDNAPITVNPRTAAPLQASIRVQAACSRPSFKGLACNDARVMLESLRGVGGITWQGWTTFINWASPAATTLAFATSMVPGLDVVTGGIAVVADAAAGVTNGINAGSEFSQHHYLKGSIDAVGTVLSFVGAGFGFKAFRAAADALLAKQAANATGDALWGDSSLLSSQDDALITRYVKQQMAKASTEEIARQWAMADLAFSVEGLVFDGGKASWEMGWWPNPAWMMGRFGI